MIQNLVVINGSLLFDIVFSRIIIKIAATMTDTTEKNTVNTVANHHASDASFGDSKSKLANGHPPERMSREEDDWSSGKIIRNLICVSSAFLFLFTAFQVINYDLRLPAASLIEIVMSRWYGTKSTDCNKNNYTIKKSYF